LTSENITNTIVAAELRHGTAVSIRLPQLAFVLVLHPVTFLHTKTKKKLKRIQETINKEKTQRFWFEILLMLGFASIGYHGYYLMKSLT
jgi:hypothetical protein